MTMLQLAGIITGSTIVGSTVGAMVGAWLGIRACAAHHSCPLSQHRQAAAWTKAEARKRGDHMITKAKLRRWLHLLGFAIVAGAVVWVWFTEDVGLPVSAKLVATGVLLTTLLTKWDEVVAPRLVRYVDALPIPETEGTTTATTTTTTSTTTPAAPIATPEEDDITQNIRPGQS